MALRYHTKKIFIQRDFSHGTGVQFSSEFPPELRGKVDESTFKQTVDQINSIFNEAESLSCRTCGEGCFACMTGYVIHFCFKTHYERCTDRVAHYIQQQNYHVYEPRGVILGDPMDRGLRCIEVNITYELNIET